MPGPTSIEWCTKSWNPTTGCDKVSPGCAHCYAETFAERWRGIPGHPYEQGFDLRLWPERLGIPLRWKKPERIFTNSMSDLFHEDIPLDFIRQVFEVMGEADWHTFLVLTKRHERLGSVGPLLDWPPNVHLGVSIENRRFVHRAAYLRRVPAAVRWISAEPLLGPLVYDGYVDGSSPSASGATWADGRDVPELDLTGIDWLVIGGESGCGARRMRLEWARDLVAACRAQGVAVFVKQLGAVWAREQESLSGLFAGMEKANRKGTNPLSWPDDLRIREFPELQLRLEAA